MTDETIETRTAFGIPVLGNKPHFPRNPIPQRPMAELALLFQTFWLANKGSFCEACKRIEGGWVESIVWEQYTPYFNDGDTCVFGVGEPRLILAETAEPHAHMATNDGCICSVTRHDTSGGWMSELNQDAACPVHGGGDIEWDDYGITVWSPEFKRLDPVLAKTFQDVAEALDSGAFNDVLYREFGDHCQIQMRSDRIFVSSYEHD